MPIQLFYLLQTYSSEFAFLLKPLESGEKCQQFLHSPHSCIMMTSAFCGNSICKNDSSFCMIISLVQDQFAMNFAGFYSQLRDKLDVFTPVAALNSRFLLYSPALNCTWSLDRELQSFNKNYNNAFCTQIFTLQLVDVQKQCTTQQFLQTSSMHKIDIFVYLLISQFLIYKQVFQKC